VTVFCRASERELAEKHCGSHNITLSNAELDDIWMRDIGANFVVDDDGALARWTSTSTAGATSSAP
jgi:agmatine deiminase